MKDKRRIYTRYYYSIEKGADDEQAFDQRVARLYQELRNDNIVEGHKSAYEQFFEIKTTPKRGRQITYKEGSIKEARRLVEHFEQYYTPKHGSWLDMAEIKIGIMSRQDLGKPLPDLESFKEQIRVWTIKRNVEHVK